MNVAPYSDYETVLWLLIAAWLVASPARMDVSPWLVAAPARMNVSSWLVAAPTRMDVSPWLAAAPARMNVSSWLAAAPPEWMYHLGWPLLPPEWMYHHGWPLLPPKWMNHQCTIVQKCQRLWHPTQALSSRPWNECHCMGSLANSTREACCLLIRVYKFSLWRSKWYHSCANASDVWLHFFMPR